MSERASAKGLTKTCGECGLWGLPWSQRSQWLSVMKVFAIIKQQKWERTLRWKRNGTKLTQFATLLKASSTGYLARDYRWHELHQVNFLYETCTWKMGQKYPSGVKSLNSSILSMLASMNVLKIIFIYKSIVYSTWSCVGVFSTAREISEH